MFTYVEARGCRLTVDMYHLIQQVKWVPDTYMLGKNGPEDTDIYLQDKAPHVIYGCQCLKGNHDIYIKSSPMSVFNWIHGRWIYLIKKIKKSVVKCIILYAFFFLLFCKYPLFSLSIKYYIHHVFVNINWPKFQVEWDLFSFLFFLFIW